MKENEKKPLFEPITPEEAKKIKASGTYDSLHSGELCESGVQDKWDACFAKSPGADCCYYYNGQEKRGKCVYILDPPERPDLPETFLYLKCNAEPYD